MFKEIRFGDEFKNVCEEMYRGNEHLFPFSSYEYLKLCKNRYRWQTHRWREKHRFYLYQNDNNCSHKILAPINLHRGKAYLYTDLEAISPLDIVYSSKVTESDFISFWNDLVKELGCDVLYVNNIREESLFYQFIEKKLQQHILHKEDSICVKIDFEDNYEEYRKSLTVNGRGNTRVMYNRINNDGVHMEFHVADTEDVRRKNFTEVVDCWRRLQETKYQRNFGGHWGKFRFFNCTPSVIGLKTMSSARLFWLELNGEIAAVETGFVANNHSFLVPRGAMNPKFKWYSPGRLLIDQMIRYFIEKTDIRCLDLTFGDERYKFDVGGKPYWCHSYEISMR